MFPVYISLCGEMTLDYLVKSNGIENVVSHFILKSSNGLMRWLQSTPPSN